jgi:hypothetical protein
VLAGSVLLQLQLGMVTAVPMQDHLDMLGFDADDDLAQSRTHDPLACRRRCRRMRPGECEIGAELHQLLALHLAQGHRLPRLDGGNVTLDPMHDLQRFVPAPLKLASYQTIGGIDRIVLSARMRSLEARSLQRQLQLPLGGRRLARLGIGALTAASMPSGFKTRNTSVPTA